MKPVLNEQPFKIGDIVTVTQKHPQWQGRRKIIDVIPCRLPRRDECTGEECLTDKKWIVLEKFSSDEAWHDREYFGEGITFCYQCL
jgi:hypothetical protein